MLITPYIMPGSETIQNAMNAIPSYPLSVTFAFWNNGNWDSGEPSNEIIAKIRKNNGDCTISFGGYSGCKDLKEPGLMGGSVQEIMQRYLDPIKKYSFLYADFDIEGHKEHDVGTYAPRNAAIALLQKQVPNLKVSFTVPADANGIYCQKMLSDAASKGVVIDTVRIMAMEFGYKVDMVSTCITGLGNTYNQLKAIGLVNVKLGFIPLLMTEGSGMNTYTLQNHQDILAQIKSKNMNYVQTFSYWELARDKEQNFNFLKAYVNAFGQMQVPQPAPQPQTPTPPRPPTPPQPQGPKQWSNNVAYKNGDKILYNNVEYTCNLNNVAIPPDVNAWTKSQSPSPSSSSSAWSPGIKYTIGIIVTYNGKKYKCTYAHTSISQWSPSIHTLALWQPIA